VAVLGITPKLPAAAPAARAEDGAVAVPREHLAIIENGVEVQAGFHDRRALLPGHRIQGPAVIEAPDTTIYLPGDFGALIDDQGNLVARLLAEGERA
jgi:N-methylhydantoinase A